MTSTFGKFRYLNPSTIYYGHGCVRQIDKSLQQRQTTRVHIVSTRSLIGSKAMDYLRHESTLLQSARVSTIAAHVPLEELLEITREIRETGADAVVALGGGSPIDAAKLASYGATSAEITTASLSDFKAILATQSSRGSLPTFCVPTTLAAAELYAAAGFTDDVTGQKDGGYHPTMTPQAVFYDPAVSSETPPDLWTTTGVRALDHATETLLAPTVDPISEVLATSAIVDLFDLLPRYAADPTSTSIRLQCHLAAWKSYTLPTVAATGLSHTLGKAVGAKNNIPHGVTSCVILPQVLTYYAQTPAMRTRIDHVAGELGLEPAPEGGCSLADAVEHLVDGLGLPTKFTRTELSEVDQLEAATRTAEQRGIPVETVRGILSACIA